MLPNGKDDPLSTAISTEGTRRLFDICTQASAGHSTEQVYTVSANLLINALRQTYATRQQAADAWDHLSTKIKVLLMDHYDSSGRRKGIFPYAQTVHVNLITEQQKF